MCEMLGYYSPTQPEPGDGPVAWGHIASDGTLANMEFVWYPTGHLTSLHALTAMSCRAARNLKFYPLSLRTAMKNNEDLESLMRDFTVHTCHNPSQEVAFASLSTWDLLNLPVDVILGIPQALHSQCGISQQFLSAAIKEYLVQETGKDELLRAFEVKEPQYLISATRHYSWPKAAGRCLSLLSNFRY
jgi:hypothetical protein